MLPDGCTDSTACNYDSAATCDDGTCLFPGDECDDGDPNTLGDVYLEDCSCSGTVGIEDEVKTTISIYPNPASTSFTIVADERLINASYRLFDVQGRLVLEGMIRAENTLVHTEALSSGNYMLSISNADQVVTQSIVLQK